MSRNTILVLTDFSEGATIALRNAAKLGKLINGKVHAYYVQPVKGMKEENQLALSRKLRETYRETQAKAKKMINTIADEEGVNISFAMDYGNVKNRILNKIEATGPELVILGKRKSRLLDLIGDRITESVIDNCDANIFISASDRELHSLSDLSLGFFGETEDKGKFKIMDHLRKTPRSIKYFGIRNNRETLESGDTIQKSGSTYMFPQEGTKAIDALTTYVARTKTDLFCIPKTNGPKPQPIKEMVGRLDIPVLVYR